MKPRKQALPVPEGPRYWDAEIGDRGVHHFRMPRYTLALAAYDHMIATEKAAGERGSLGRIIEQAHGVAALLGVCWHHRGMELESPIPSDLNASTMRALADAVLDEMQDYYDLLEIHALGIHCLGQVAERLDVTQMASARAGFFGTVDSAERAEPEAEAASG